MVLELDGKSLMELVEKFQILSGRMCFRYGMVLKTASVKQLILEPTHYGELFI